MNQGKLFDKNFLRKQIRLPIDVLSVFDRAEQNDAHESIVEDEQKHSWKWGGNDELHFRTFAFTWKCERPVAIVSCKRNASRMERECEIAQRARTHYDEETLVDRHGHR